MSGGINTPAQAVAAANSWLTYAHRFCLQAVSRMYQKGSPTQASAVDPPIDDVATAAQEWARCPAQYRHEGRAAALAAPVGALIVCGNGDGHIFIVVAPGMGRSTDYPTAGRMGTASIANILAHFSGNPVLGWISWINGNTIDGLGVAPTGPMQRVARSDVGIIRRRSAASSASTLLDPALQPGETGNFLGYVHGERVNQNGVNSDVWLVGISKNYFWLGGFVDRDLHDLPDLTPATTTTPSDPGPTYKVASLGVDVSGSQSSVTAKAFKDAGVEWALVKWGGANASLFGPTATHDAQVRDFRSESMPVGHYFNTGQADPVACAEFFAKNLTEFDVQHDALMLDNEPYPGDKSGHLWTPDQCAAFFKRLIELTGIEPKRTVLYAAAATYKNGQDWSVVFKLGTLRGYASWGNQPYATALHPTRSSSPEPPAVLGGGFDLTQFSSNVQVGGVAVDGWASPMTTAEIFATGSVTPPATTPPTGNGGGSTDPGPGTTDPDGGSTPTNPQPSKGQKAGIWAGLGLLLAGVIVGLVSAISHLF